MVEKPSWLSVVMSHQNYCLIPPTYFSHYWNISWLCLALHGAENDLEAAQSPTSLQYSRKHLKSSIGHHLATNKWEKIKKPISYIECPFSVCCLFMLLFAQLPSGTNVLQLFWVYKLHIYNYRQHNSECSGWSLWQFKTTELCNTPTPFCGRIYAK